MRKIKLNGFIRGYPLFLRQSAFHSVFMVFTETSSGASSSPSRPCGSASNIPRARGGLPRPVCFPGNLIPSGVSGNSRSAPQESRRTPPPR